MLLDATKKTELIKQFGGSEKNTGSTEAQVAMLTHRIKHLTEHLKDNRKDYGTLTSLTKLVSKRKGLLKYLMSSNLESYRSLIKELGLRR